MQVVDLKYDDRYKLTDNGIVIRKQTIDSRKRVYPEKIMKHYIGTSGYQSVCVRGIRYFVHRILAEHFIPNPENKKEVNHKNGIRSDFRLENLEWVTRTENQIHSWKELGRVATWQGKTGHQNKRAKRVNQYDVDGNFITQHGSLNEAGKALNYHPESIGQAIRKKGGYYKGITFTYAI